MRALSRLFIVNTAAALALTTVGVAPATADGDDTAAIAYSQTTNTHYIVSSVSEPSRADDLVMNQCHQDGINDCVIVAYAVNGCVSLAVSDVSVAGGIGPYAEAAEADAYTRNGGGDVLSTQCSSNVGSFDGSATRITLPAATDEPAQWETGVTGDVDVYDEPGGTGTVIGMLHEGDVVVQLGECRADNWCETEAGWVWGDYLAKG